MINRLKEIANNPIVLWRALASRRISDMTDIISNYSNSSRIPHYFYVIANISAENGQNCITLEFFLNCYAHVCSCYLEKTWQIVLELPFFVFF